MSRYIENIIDYTEDRLTPEEQKKFQATLKTNPELWEDYAIFRQVNTYMRGKFDLEEVRNDPDLAEIDLAVNEAIEEYSLDPGKYRDAQSFILDNTGFIESNREMEEEINQIKREIIKNGVDEISEGWVTELRQKSEDQKMKDPVTEEIRDYVINSINGIHNASEIKVVHRQDRNQRVRALIYRISLTAAVITAGFMLLKISLFSGDPDKLYKKYYTTFDAITPVTRNNNSELSYQFRQAVELFKDGNYIHAASAFSLTFKDDTSFIAPRFMEGITKMELGEFNQAISSFNYVMSHSDEYRTESQWYLGLAYMKTDEMNKAANCFISLAAHEGYYQERAEKLLRRLK